MIYSAPSDTRWPDPLAQTFGHHSGENARLIAALPRLLAACKGVLPVLFGFIWLEERREAVAEFEAAILEAEGEAS